jgi:hypothetical protein
MQTLEYSFKQWMQQPGVVKQLQLALTVSIVIIILLTQQLISNNLIKHESNKEKSAVNETNTASQHQVTEDDLNNLIQKYLTEFFSTKEEALEFLKAHTVTDLYLSSIEPEVKKRIELKLTSTFELNDLYLESINATQAKAICIGQENFPNGDYQPRNFHIEIIIDTSSMKVVAIPVFQIN